MDWTQIVTVTVSGLTGIAVAWLGVIAKRTEKQTNKVEQSINNRELPMSDRMDLIHEDVRSVRTTQREHGQRLERVEQRSIDTRVDLREHVAIAQKADTKQAKDSVLLHQLAEIYLPKDKP